MINSNTYLAHYRQSDGQYVIRLPLKSCLSQVGDLLRAAQYSLLHLRKRWNNNPAYKELCFVFLKEYKDLVLMKRIKLKDSPPNSYFLLHHGTLKKQRTTNKEDHHLQCILWFHENDIPTVLMVATVTYVTTSVLTGSNYGKCTVKILIYCGLTVIYDGFTVSLR